VYHGFERATRTVDGNAIHYVRGGSGAPLLLATASPASTPLSSSSSSGGA